MANNQNLKPFIKGDSRCWRKGRPKTFDAARELAQSIAQEVAQANGSDVVIEKHKVTVIEAILRKWASSKDPRLQMAFVEYAYGKPPTKTELTGSDGGAINIVEVHIPKVDE